MALPVFAALLSVAAPAAAQDPLAPAAARELRQICDADRARLWGVDLCGPVLVVDPATRLAWASQPDSGGVLQPSGAGWVGPLPADVAIANTSVEWAGTRWIMLRAPLPENAADRRVLLAHEAWHRVQASLGLPQTPSDCAHLDTERGRYLLRLELRALATAMRSRGRARTSAARDALMFRAARLEEFADAAAQEAALDRNEGLAAYTGVRLGAGDNPSLYAARTLDHYDRHDAFTRAYAYASGPAYGLLLDDVQPSWRTLLGPHAPADLLRTAIRAGGPPNFAAAVARYGGEAIAREETARAAEQAARLAAIRGQYEAGPRLVLPLRAMQMTFDPERVTPVPGLGAFYATLTVRDAWGELRATDGAIISADFTRIILPAPAQDGRSGPGWTLTLVAGVQISAPDLQGVRTIVSRRP